MRNPFRRNSRLGPVADGRRDLQTLVNERIVPAGWRDAARDAHGVRIDVGDRLRWIGRPGDTPGRNPAPGATGHAKAVYNPSAVWFWLDEPTGAGPGGDYWDSNPWLFERLGGPDGMLTEIEGSEP